MAFYLFDKINKAWLFFFFPITVWPLEMWKKKSIGVVWGFFLNGKGMN